MTRCHGGDAERLSCPQGGGTPDSCCPQPEGSYPQAEGGSPITQRVGFDTDTGSPGAVTRPGERGSGQDLAQDPVDGGATNRALTQNQKQTKLRDLHRALEVALLLALDAVAVVR